MLLRRIAFVFAACVSFSPAWLYAQSTPSGLWETFDEQTGKASSHVRVDESNGALRGSIDRILDPSKADARCVACEDERKDQPITGMVIFRDVKAHADAPLTWDGGEILDPKNGRTYKVRIRLIEDGNVLEVRGYKGSPMFGRTQLWLRVLQPAAVESNASASAPVGTPASAKP